MSLFIKKSITTSLSPNSEPDDVRLALKLLLSPWSWIKGTAQQNLEGKLAGWLDPSGRTKAFSFNSGRSALWALLKAMGIGREDEVIIQAYTCVAVPDSVLWTGARPVYVDIDPATFNIDPEKITAKITKKTKAVIVQHTFGCPVDIEGVKKIAGRHGLYLIEDCAHALGARYHKKPLGTLGDGAIFSLGRDKVISSVFGGLAATNNPEIAANLERVRFSLGYPSRFWTAQQLLHPILIPTVVLPSYNLLGGMGKVLLVLMQKSRILSRLTSPVEKQGGRPAHMPALLPEALARLGLNQLAKLERFNRHRRKIAAFYDESLKKLEEKKLLRRPVRLPNVDPIYLRYSIIVPKADQLRLTLRRRGVVLGDWYNVPVAPFDVDAESVGYRRGSCRIAEKISVQTLNLPTHTNTTLRDAARVVQELKTELLS